MRRRPSDRAVARGRRAALLGASLIALASPRLAHAQDGQTESPEVVRALELEGSRKFREAAPIFRAAMSTKPTPIVVLSLERVYSELGMTDSLLAPLDSVIRKYPREPLYHMVQLRSLQILRRYDQLQSAFERWLRDMPRDATPYAEYARILIDLGRPSTADSVIERGRVALGTARDLQYQTALVRAAMGQWEPSATAWRSALTHEPHLASAAAYSLAPAPAAVRPALRKTFGAPPIEGGARRALAELEIAWGQPQSAWEALRPLKPDTASARVWADFGERAMTEERYGLARDALTAAVKVQRTPELALKAATAALRAGAPAEALALTPASDWESDPRRAVRDYLPIRIEALSALGRGAEAQALLDKYDRQLAPGQHDYLARLIAKAWVRGGDLARAKEALRAAGADADSSDAAGLIALYEGRLADARALLRGTRDQSADMALVLGVLSRVRGDAGPQLGAAFLALARGDSAAAAQRFVEAAERHEEASSALLLTAARIQAARGDGTPAIVIWQRIVSQYGTSPESAEAELEWARALRKRGDVAKATEHLEHLILSAPNSALLPQARRELELTRGAVPP